MAQVTRRLMKRRRGERGAEILELAIVLPILLLVVAGILDFGFMFQRYETLTNAAREGARLASLPAYSDDPGDVAIVKQRVRDYLSASGLDPAQAVIPDPTYAPTPISGGGPIINMVTVEVSYPAGFSYLAPIASLIGGSAGTSTPLRAVSVMRTEAPASGS
jgi:Flp pilus assembly protein TadG